MIHHSREIVQSTSTYEHREQPFGFSPLDITTEGNWCLIHSDKYEIFNLSYFQAKIHKPCSLLAQCGIMHPDPEDQIFNPLPHNASF